MCVSSWVHRPYVWARWVLTSSFKFSFKTFTSSETQGQIGGTRKKSTSAQKFFRRNALSLNFFPAHFYCLSLGLQGWEVHSWVFILTWTSPICFLKCDLSYFNLRLPRRHMVLLHKHLKGHTTMSDLACMPQCLIDCYSILNSALWGVLN